MKSRSHEIDILSYRIALTLDKHFGSTAAEVPVKFHSDRIIKSPRVTGGLIVFGPFPPPSPPPPPPPFCQHFSIFREILKLISSNYTWSTYGCGKILAPISVILGQGHYATEAGHTLSCPHDKIRTAHPIATKLGRYIPLITLSFWLNFGGILLKTFIAIFCKMSNKMRFPESNILFAIS